MRGKLIVLEGPDRSGKSSQLVALLESLQSTGTTCELMRFPDRTTKTGSLIDAYLKGTGSEVGISDKVVMGSYIGYSSFVLCK